MIHICVTWSRCVKATVYHKKYAHGFVVLCFVVVMQSFIMNSHEVFIHIHQGCFAGTGAIVRLPQCQWSKPDGYGKISQCITTTKHSKGKTMCIFLGIYCIMGSVGCISDIYQLFSYWSKRCLFHTVISFNTTQCITHLRVTEIWGQSSHKTMNIAISKTMYNYSIVTL